MAIINVPVYLLQHVLSNRKKDLAFAVFIGIGFLVYFHVGFSVCFNIDFSVSFDIGFSVIGP
jgi:hypothetical protein